MYVHFSSNALVINVKNAFRNSSTKMITDLRTNHIRHAFVVIILSVQRKHFLKFSIWHILSCAI